jgi:hypothetical protein
VELLELSSSSPTACSFASATVLYNTAADEYPGRR